MNLELHGNAVEQTMEPIFRRHVAPLQSAHVLISGQGDSKQLLYFQSLVTSVLAAHL